MTISKEFGLIKFQYENIEFITKLIDIEYPEYKTVIPKDVPNILKINTTNFCQAIDRADLMTTLNSVAVELKLEKDKITIFKATQGLGKEQEEIEVNYKGQEFRIGFNSKYLLDVLNNINEKEIELRFKDESSPCLIKVKNKYIYLLLPILLK